jgi:hypothetical protein
MRRAAELSHSQSDYNLYPNDPNGFEPVASITPTVMKEISRRVELRARLEAEHGGPIDDRTFLAIAERDGIRL